MEDKRLTCPVPWCQAAICSSPARRIIATRDEVPPGCANVISTQRSESPRLHDIRDAEWTPAARQVLALGGSGDCRTMLAKIAEGRLVFLEPRTPRPLRSTPPIRRRPQPAPEAPISPASEKTAWIKFRVVDDQSGDALPGVLLKVTQPNGRMFDYTTRPDGMVEVDGIDPGACDVASGLEGASLADTYHFVTIGDKPMAIPPASEPSANENAAPLDAPADESGKLAARTAVSRQGVRIAQIEEHRVRSGESIKSLAEQNGLTWQQLAIFNWETDVPDEINVKLADEVGCTQKAPDGVNYRFDDTDKPGLVMIPKPWSAKGLATEQTHTIRVRAETRFFLILENDDGMRIPEAEYEVVLADGSTRTGRLGRGGVAVIKNPPPGDLKVYYPDLDDVEAKSLAATARKAFDLRDSTELHRLFRYPKETIQRAFTAYADHFNDYHGKGLRGDIEHEYGSDAEASELFFAYMGSEGQPGAIEEPVQEAQIDAGTEADRG